ncbi:SWIM zinc finger family protein [Clostridium sp. CMCC3677]|uniref:SWIM zinc finger family protein n=1 Tax=Clostridium sp. CMCC3677 TaxID=2949963 RepID=UPI0013F125F7|nr:SWIM zinc finger family protein [Clostridium sp. CMCC3677]NFG61015.1 SWIM zinc finger family protein [Clostridium botulinum]NFQ09400.1 SWIM zinc finger family protein [Clostridium botulinum]
MKLTKEYVESTAYNASSFNNAKKLVSKNQIIKTHIIGDKTLIYGECMGSGKKNYIVSVDFINENEPVFRCSCPSRQIPCKHATALLYQYFEDSSKFETGEIPEDVLRKREKIEKKEEKKKEEIIKPKKVNVSAFIKKMKTQLEGLEIVDKFINDTLSVGLASITLSQIKIYNKELIKSLNSNYYLPEHSVIMGDILENLRIIKEDKDIEDEIYYEKTLDSLGYIQNLNVKARAVLNKHIKEKKFIDEESADIFTKLGYIWKLSELRNLGFYSENGKLLQLGFYCEEDDLRKTYIDTGFYINLSEDKIYKTMNYRPYRISNKIKEEDTIFEVFEVPEFYIYPGQNNPRIRFEGGVMRKVSKEDIKEIRKSAKTNYKEALKEVKIQLKNTLYDKHPIFLMHYNELVKFGEELAIKDDHGETIMLKNTKDTSMPSTLENLKFMLGSKYLKENVMLGIFEHDLNTGKLTMQPISVVTDDQIIRILG